MHRKMCVEEKEDRLFGGRESRERRCGVISRARRGAFTLIELLIVVAIIAILALIAVPNFLEAQTRAKVARAKNDLRTIDVALTAYHVDHNTYPPWTERNGDRIHPCSWRFAWLTTPIA